VCLAAAAALQGALRAHLAAGEEAVASASYLQKPLQGVTGFPVSRGAWYGKEETPDPATLRYFDSADDKLNRSYVRHGEDGEEAGPACRLWMVHFRDGQDRQHHPLICYQVAGFTEVPSGREALPLDGNGSPAQRFCFTRGGDARYGSYVYYWHYTFEPDVPGLSLLQRLHAAWAVHPSLTVQVFTAAQTPEGLSEAAAFVRQVDRELQAFLPPGARRGSETLPVTMRR
jgi:hypothetical protein